MHAADTLSIIVSRWLVSILELSRIIHSRHPLILGDWCPSWNYPGLYTTNTLFIAFGWLVSILELSTVDTLSIIVSWVTGVQSWNYPGLYTPVKLCKIMMEVERNYKMYISACKQLCNKLTKMFYNTASHGGWGKSLKICNTLSSSTGCNSHGTICQYVPWCTFCQQKYSRRQFSI